MSQVDFHSIFAPAPQAYPGGRGGVSKQTQGANRTKTSPVRATHVPRDDENRAGFCFVFLFLTS